MYLVLRYSVGNWDVLKYSLILKSLKTIRVVTEKVLFHIPSIDKCHKWYPFHIPCLERCIPFNCCKCTVIWMWIKHKAWTFSRLFHSHNMHLLALWGLFTDQHDRFPYPFIYLKPEKGTPFGLFNLQAWPRNWTRNYRKKIQQVARAPGLEPGTAGLRVQRADHSATLPPYRSL